MTTGWAPGEHLAAAIVDRTGGNPLFVTEVGRLLASGADATAGDWPVPPGIRQAIRARIARLPGVAGPLAAAAVLGREFDLPALAVLTATPAAAPDHAERAARSATRMAAHERAAELYTGAVAALEQGSGDLAGGVSC